ncbi:response regulator transcription factor [Aquisalimonas lutea]|uniref:response regulator n=1 Tax=Aquisalimonas lutea TaxID=1327750 RepID=UPI0025B41DD2|nr:response regulator transcription factor [Aquisalimonas lutea]MDN3519506.1 response regulator transcription factor [Aquisalimonas lutea]
MIRVLLADDHRLIRSALMGLINSFEGIQVVAEAGSGSEAIAAARSNRTDIALVDSALLPMDSGNLIAQLQSVDPAVNILVVSTYISDSYIRRLIASGARGFIHKDATVDELETAIREAAAGRQPICPGREPIGPCTTERETDQAPARHASLTRRQREVLRLLAHGYRSRAIAEELNLSVKTVETHRTQIMRRLGRQNMAGLVHDAIRLGLLPVPR